MKYKKVQMRIRGARVRSKIRKLTSLPRLSVFRSNKHVYAQIIDDSSSSTLVYASDIKTSKGSKESKLEKAKEVGINLAKSATSKKIKKIVFDRGGYRYHGRIKAVAEGAREGGLEF